MSAFSVSSSSGAMVQPCEPTPSGDLNLSVIDKVPELRFKVRLLYVFKEGNEKSVEIIRRALSKALVPYYPLAGRLQETSGGQLHVSCTGEGVWFVEAYADSTLADVNYIDDAPLNLQEKLLPNSIPVLKGQDPVVLMQVTSFKCRGFVMGVIFPHSISDGTGISQFLNTVGEFARGLEHPSVEPVWFRDEIPTPSPLRLPKAPPPVLIPHYELKYAPFDFSRHQIDRLKREFTLLSGKACSTFEVLTAILWKSRTRAINLPHSSIIKLIFYSNARRFLNPRPPKGFYGNCIFPVTVAISSGWLAEAPLEEVVKLIQETKAKFPDHFKKWMYGKGDEDLIEEPFTAPLDYATLCISDIEHSGQDFIDYGWGHPIQTFPVELSHVMNTHPFGFLCMPPRPKTGIRLKTWCVDDPHMLSFHDEIIKLLKLNCSRL
ncbi:hypothetical protein Sjap_011239 [Stephania japonica]|uniref:Acyl transferase 4 n=1 Tax=Stephania japonica TaxID=461633 RepID=A0AAP0JAR8_9MAGN